MKTLPPASIQDAVNLADPAIRLGQMTASVQAIRETGTLWYSLLNMIATYIDGLASGPKGGTRAAYIAYVKAHFLELHSELGAESFYDNFRSSTIHEFGLKKGYAIGRDSGLNGSYVAIQPFKETPEHVVVLNIDRLAADFLAHVNALQPR